MRVRQILFALCALWLVALAAPALIFSQTPERIAKLEISVWPEFDDPRVLVQYDGELVGTSGTPREVAFYIPATAQLIATAYQDETKQFLNSDPPTVTDAGNGLKRVSFIVPKSHFHLEYYDDAIKGAPDKQLDFVYTALLPADSVQIQVQQPLKADNFAIVPAAALISEGMHDFKYYIFNYAGIPADSALKLQINYVKSDPNPSIQNVVAPETAPQTNPVDTAVAPNPQQVYLLVGAGIAFALGLLGLWMWYTRRQPHLAFAGAGANSGAGKRAERFNAFCSQCGNGLRAADNFCPKCGAKRK